MIFVVMTIFVVMRIRYVKHVIKYDLPLRNGKLDVEHFVDKKNVDKMLVDEITFFVEQKNRDDSNATDCNSTPATNLFVLWLQDSADGRSKFRVDSTRVSSNNVD